MVKTEADYLAEHAAIERQLEQKQREQHADFFSRGYLVGRTEGYDEGYRAGLRSAPHRWVVLGAFAVFGAAVTAIVFGVLQLL